VLVARNDRVDAARSACEDRRLFCEVDATSAFWRRGLEGENGDPETRRELVPLPTCGVGVLSG